MTETGKKLTLEEEIKKAENEAWIEEGLDAMNRAGSHAGIMFKAGVLFGMNNILEMINDKAREVLKSAGETAP